MLELHLHVGRCLDVFSFISISSSFFQYIVIVLQHVGALTADFSLFPRLFDDRAVSAHKCPTIGAAPQTSLAGPSLAEAAIGGRRRARVGCGCDARYAVVPFSVPAAVVVHGVLCPLEQPLERLFHDPLSCCSSSRRCSLLDHFLIRDVVLLQRTTIIGPGTRTLHCERDRK